jgi:tetraacyldisaccharide 4'-kinase
VDDADPSSIPERLARAIRSALSVGPSAAAPNEAALRCAAMLPPGRLPPALPARPLLWPLAPLWRLAVALDQRRSSVKAPLPVISLGALSAGGAGKTPAVAWLAAQVPGAWVLGRGYRRRGPGPALRVGLPEQPPEHDLGDELEMMRRRGLAVISCPDRLEGATEAARRGARLLLLDDGFQHRALHRDIDVVCIDGRWPQGRGPIPVGEEREGPEALERAHFLWLHHARSPAASAFKSDQPLIRSHLVPQDWLIAGQAAPLSAVQGEVDVVVGIARPEGFLCTLVQLGLSLRSLRLLPDHAQPDELPPHAVMTEKDAARLPPGAPVRALRMRLVVEGAEPLLAEARRWAGR